MVKVTIVNKWNRGRCQRKEKEESGKKRLGEGRGTEGKGRYPTGSHSTVANFKRISQNGH